MSEVSKSDTDIHATADATNPFAPIDYTSRLKTPSRHTGTFHACLLYTSPSPRDRQKSRMPSSA